MDAIDNIPTDLIDPSPYQARKRFKNIAELAKSIQDIGLIEPVIVRPMDGRFELIAGERRWRAIKSAELGTILAIKRDVDNSTARRMSLEENIKRDDLTKVEEIDAWILHVDAELWKDEEYRNYAEMNDWPDEFDNQQARLRVRWLLKRLDSVRQSNYVHSFHKFVERVNIIFSQHPRSAGWRPFLYHDIPVLDLPELVLEMAIEKNLNKSQTKALGKIVEKGSQEADEILAQGTVTVRKDFGFEEVPIEEASSREIEKAPDCRRWKKGCGMHVHFSSDTPEWYTPPQIIKRVLKVMGEIDLDPCSNSHRNPNVPAKRHYTRQDNGLAQEWHGRVYMNPPYGLEIADWVDYLCGQLTKGNVTEAIALLPARTDTEWFRRLRQYPRCFIWGRLRFSGNEVGAPFPSMVVYMGKNLDGFVEIFSDIGDVYVLWSRARKESI